MATLSNERKQHLIGSESKKKFHDKLTKAEKAFGDELDKLCKKTHPSWLTDEIKNSGMLKTTNSVDVYGLNSDGPDYCDSDETVWFRTYNQHPIKGYGNLKIEASKTLINKRAKVVAIEKEQNEFEAKLRKVLYSVNTDKKLTEHLPELSDYIQTSSGHVAALIPVGEIKEMKTLLAKK